MSLLINEAYANKGTPLWAKTGSGGGGNVQSVSAGTGISITGTASDPVVNNTGILSVGAGTGIAVGGTSTAPVVYNNGVRSLTAGYGMSLGGTANDPVVNNEGCILLQYANNDSVGGIKITNSLQSILGTTIIPVPLNKKTRAVITFSIRMQNTTGTSDDYFIDPVINGVSVRTGNTSAYDYTTTGNGHWTTLSMVCSGTIPAGTLGYATFDVFMKNATGVGTMYVYSVNASISLTPA